MTPTRRTVLLLAAGLVLALLPAAGWHATWPAFLMFWAGTALVLGMDARTTPRRDRIRWELVSPTVLYVGGQGRLALELRVATRRSLPVEAAIGLSQDLVPAPNAQGTLGAGRVGLEWALIPTRRGVAGIETLWIRLPSPLGFWSRRITLPVGREIPVLPDIPRVRAAAIRFFADREFRAGLKIERYRGDGSEFDSLKEFLPGDDHRSMDWKASARHRRLLCRQHRAERNHQVILALDTGRLMSELLGETSRLDHALNAALLLAYVCLKSGDRVGMFTFDARVGMSLEPVHGVEAMSRLIRAAAKVSYSRDETNFTLGLTTLLERLRRRSLVILLTDFSDSVTAGIMTEHLGRVIRRHVVVFVSVRDPVMTSIATGPPDDLDALGRSVVARDLLRDRDRVHRSLRHLGMPVLDVPPDRIAPGLIDAYLDIKRRERV